MASARSVGADPDDAADGDDAGERGDERDDQPDEIVAVERLEHAPSLPKGLRLPPPPPTRPSEAASHRRAHAARRTAAAGAAAARRRTATAPARQRHVTSSGTVDRVGRLTSTRSLPSALGLNRDHFHRTHAWSSEEKRRVARQGRGAVADGHRMDVHHQQQEGREARRRRRERHDQHAVDARPVAPASRRAPATSLRRGASTTSSVRMSTAGLRGMPSARFIATADRSRDHAAFARRASCR